MWKFNVKPFSIQPRNIASNQCHQSHAIHMVSNRFSTLYPVINPSFPFCGLRGKYPWQRGTTLLFNHCCRTTVYIFKIFHIHNVASLVWTGNLLINSLQITGCKCMVRINTSFQSRSMHISGQIYIVSAYVNDITNKLFPRILTLFLVYMVLAKRHLPHFSGMLDKRIRKLSAMQKSQYECANRLLSLMLR